MSTEDQASRLRELVQQARRTRTIAIASGKGGVGKSHIALNLSVLLSAIGSKVALVDADWGLANLDVLLDVDVRANLADVMAGHRRLVDIIIDLPSGVQFVPGGSGLARMASLSDFQRAQLVSELSTLEADNDIVLIDVGAGISPDVTHFVCSADAAVVVTAPEPTAITDAYALIKVLTQADYQGQISLLVNFAADRHEARMTYQRISGVAKQFLGITVYDAGYVLNDPKVKEAVRRREPFVQAFPRCPASRCLAAVVNKLNAGSSLVDSRMGFFRRVANWFA
jgi:flagellar biosynthesis protein FlhG